MGVDQTSLDRIRNATFPSAKRGYDRQEVEKFLSRLADWLETGGGDESRSETVKRELERVGERTGAILATAEDSAQQIISEAEELARETRAEAEAYGETTRGEADRAARQARDDADADARAAVADAEAKAQRIVDEGTRRRSDIEAVIADLVNRRDEVLDDTERLGAKLTAAIDTHRPLTDADPFSVPEELDPELRGGTGSDGEPHAGTDLDDAAEAEAEETSEAEAGSQPDDVDLEPEEPEPESEPEPEVAEAEKKPATKKRKKPRRPTSKRTRRIKA